MNDIETRHVASATFARKAQRYITETLATPDFALAIKTKTSRTDMVTQVDKAVENLLAAQITDAFPADRIVGEEFGTSGGGGRYEWVVDPIDGTTNFVYGFPAYAISIAIRDTQSGQTVSGVVLDLARDRLYEATLGGGATANSVPIQVTDQDRLSNSLIATGFSYSDEMRVAQGKVVAAILGNIRDIRRAGAASIDLCMVAAGELDGYYESGLWPWDYLAGALVVTEAGGSVSGGEEPEPSGTMLVASNGKIHQDLRLAIRL